jgi:uncharacterized membrane-anchored protein
MNLRHYRISYKISKIWFGISVILVIREIASFITGTAPYAGLDDILIMVIIGTLPMLVLKYKIHSQSNTGLESKHKEDL